MAGPAVARGYYWPSLTAGLPRAAVVTSVTLALAWINVLGIRQSAWIVNVLTIAKLAPLALFIVVGLGHVDAGRLGDLQPVTFRQAMAAALLLIFVSGGYEVVTVPALRLAGPPRAVPIALGAATVTRA